MPANRYEELARLKKVDALLDELANLQRNAGGRPHQSSVFVPFVRRMTRDQRAAVECMAEVKRCSDETWAQVVERLERRAI